MKQIRLVCQAGHMEYFYYLTKYHNCILENSEVIKNLSDKEITSAYFNYDIE